MKIHSIIPNNPKLRLRLQDNNVKNSQKQNLLSKQKSFLRINTRKISKQQEQKISFQLESHEKIKTFISLPKNRKNSLSHSISSLQKKISRENKQKIEELILTKPLQTFIRNSENALDAIHPLQIVQHLLISNLAIQRENQQIAIQKQDLTAICSILLNPSSPSIQNHHRFSSIFQLLKDRRSYSDRRSKSCYRKESRTTNLKIQRNVVKLAYLPFRQPKKNLAISSNILQYTHKHGHHHDERNSYQFQIRRLRDSLLSQQTLVTNIKNGHRIKHLSRQDDRLDIPTPLSKPENSPALDYVLQQNELLMKVANQEFKKYQSQIYEYGLLLQSKHLEIDLEYQEFSAQDDQDTSVSILQETLRTTILNPNQADCHKYDQIYRALQLFLDKMRLKDTKLKKLIEIKSTFISQFSSKMEFWIQSLAFKKEFTRNLASYIERQSEYTQDIINHLRRSLSDRGGTVLTKIEELRTSFEVFFENLLNSHQFS